MKNSYLIHYNHNHDRLGRFASSVGGAVSSAGSSIFGKKKQAPPAADIKGKPGGSKSDNRKLSKDQKAHLMNSASLEEISKNRDRLSNKELEYALNRVEKERNTRANLEKRLSDLQGPEAQSTIEKGTEMVQKAVDSGKSVKDLAETGRKFWNFAASVHNLNAEPNDKWPTFDEKGKPQKQPSQYDAIDLIQKGSATEIWENRDKLTTDQIKEAKNRRDALAQLEADMKKEKFAKDQAEVDKMVTEESKKQKADIEKYEAKQRREEAKKAKAAEKEAARQTKLAEKEAAKQAKREENTERRATFERSQPSMWNDRYNKYEEQALRDASSQNREAERESARRDAQRERINDIPVQVYEPPSYSQPHSRDSLSTSYQPTQAVKDFVHLYYDQPIVDVAVDAGYAGYQIYKQRKKQRY